MLPVLFVILSDKAKNKRKKRVELEYISEEKLNRFNLLCKCGSCNRLFRTYQSILKVIKEELYFDEYRDEDGDIRMLCPHCSTSRGFHRVEKEYEWMKTNGDCPMIDKEGVRNIGQMLRHADELVKEKEEIDSFMEYNKLAPEDMTWVKNLIRENKSENK